MTAEQALALIYTLAVDALRLDDYDTKYRFYLALKSLSGEYKDLEEYGTTPDSRRPDRTPGH